MKGIDNFDLLGSPLEGTNLIEASAGTGKTHTIAGLFLRLVVEKKLPVNEILVVTFTEAATEELKDRIRTTLRETIGVFSGGNTQNTFLTGLAERHKGSKTALRHLNEALRAFDQAAIFTIHGFCRRMLHENAFESGSLFDTELITDQENLKREIVDDFWRKHFYESSPLFVNYALNNNFNPDSLFDLLANWVSQPYLRILPDVGIPDCSQQENQFIKAFEEVSDAWKSAKEEVEEIFTTHEGLNRVKFGKDRIPLWIRSMDHYVDSRSHNPKPFNDFTKFTASELQASIKKGHVAPVHPFFETCERLKKAFDELDRVFAKRLLGLKAELFHYSEMELATRKGKKNIQSFDDLLLKLNKALEEKGGIYLAGAMRAKFKAALIDEFQDTDPIQYAIFRKVFGIENRTLFLIGDPKQAIYGFRGADIFSYMKAKDEVKSRYTLRENWRSDPHLITAVNAIFAQSRRPFVYDDIAFHPAVPANKKNRESLTLDGQSNAPFQLWFVAAGRVTGSKKPMIKSQAQKMISVAVAAEISRLLRQRDQAYALDRPGQGYRSEPVRQGDIAVLVRTNAEARLMQAALTGFHIHSVLYSTGDLFDTHEATELTRVLSGIRQPNNERFLRPALATDMMGVSGEDIERLMEGETGWENWLVAFKVFHDLWKEHGFIHMFRHLLIQQNVLPRLLPLPDGERRSTNLLHLVEVLHQRSVEKKLGMAGLLKWLSQKINGGTPGSEEHPLRLESDENAVKLVTIHKSKGLEYPIVFCPFIWNTSRIKAQKGPFTFHDEHNNMTLTLDLGSSFVDGNRSIAEKELLAENLRLLYVALTRARNRCYFVWGRFNGAETSAPAYLLHLPDSWEGGDIVAATGKRFMGLNDEDVLTDLKTGLNSARGAIRLSEMPIEPEEPLSPSYGQEETLTCRHFSGAIDRQWRISSFSSLVSGMRHADELPDRDAIGLPNTHDQRDVIEPDTEEPLSDIYSFPRGTKPGTFFHDILEHLDFTEDDPALMKAQVAHKLREYHFESHWLDAIYATITNVLAVPLDPELEGLTFSCIQNRARLNELEFYFPLKSISPKKLNMIFQANCGHQPAYGEASNRNEENLRFQTDLPETIERLQFAPTQGFMRGFMDLVFHWRGRFYLVDWKSNFLGGRIEDYGQESLRLEMIKAFYVLQYVIYTLALDQYLRLRIPDYRYDKHFGGVYYVFLRGVDPEIGPNFGIYRDVPSPALINALREGLIEERGEFSADAEYAKGDF